MTRHTILPRSFIATAVALAGVLVLSASARAALQVQVTYTNGQIVTGPLSFGLSQLPTSVTATIFLQEPIGSFGLEDVISLSLDFGDAQFTEADLHSLSIVPEVNRGAGDIETFTTLSYTLGGAAGSPLATYEPLRAIAPAAVNDPVSSSTPTVDGKIAGNGNFALDIFGVDIQSDAILHYHYSTSEQIGTLVSSVPEPSLFTVWFLLAMACGCVRRR